MSQSFVDQVLGGDDWFLWRNIHCGNRNDLSGGQPWILQSAREGILHQQLL